MQVTAYEGIIENGIIKLKTNVNLPEKMRVYVIIPNLEAEKTVRVYSPRLVHPEQAVDFKKEIIEESPNADL
jgi:predicted DNA-binding antitoxin AbrB/MazE fold protein